MILGKMELHLIIVEGKHFFMICDQLWASLVAQRLVCLQCGRPGFDPWVGKIP